MESNMLANDHDQICKNPNIILMDGRTSLVHHEKPSNDCLLIKRTGASGDNIPSHGGHEPETKNEKAKLRQRELKEPFVPLKPYKSPFPMNQGEFHPVLEMSTVFTMRSRGGYSTNFVGEFTVENNTNQYYGFKVKCNKSALGVYETSPNIECVPPFQRITVHVEVNDTNFSPYFAKGDSLIVQGHRLGGLVDKSTLKKFMNRMAVVWPRIGEKFKLKPLFLEPGASEILDTLEESERQLKLAIIYAKVMKTHRIPKQELGLSLNTLTQELHSSELENRRLMSGLQRLEFLWNWVVLGFCVIFMIWFIIPYYMHGEPELMEEPVIEVDVADNWSIWSTIWSIATLQYDNNVNMFH